MGMVWVARLADETVVQHIMSEPDSAYDFINPEEDWEAAAPDTIDLDKEWHATHHLLTGDAHATDHPLSLILGEYEAVGEDCGYGPACFIPSDRLRAFHDAVSTLSKDDLHKRYDPGAMVEGEVYLGEVFHEEGDEGFEFLFERVQALREFAAKAASSGRSAFAVIT